VVRWQVVTAYAKYLSPDFYEFVLEAFREGFEGDIILTNMPSRSPIRRSGTCSPSRGASLISSGPNPVRSVDLASQVSSWTS
jgi:hypothetical protein